MKTIRSRLFRRFALNHSQNRGAHAHEDNAQEQQKQSGRQKLATADRCIDDRELAHKGPERWRAGDREEASQKQSP